MTSLAVEPTYFATVIMFTLLIALCNKLIDRHMLIKGIIMIVFLAKSSTIFGLSCIALLLLLAAQMRVSHLKYIVLSAIITWAIINFTDNRLSTLLRIFIENPQYILSDDSVNVRLLNIYFPWLLAIDNFFVPYGFGSFETVFLKSVHVNNHYISE
ncbi:hypothetical protein N8Z59_03690, partial [Planktomarina temperata]|nr:hypothetical protein [Planktomarina temperata]